MKADELKKRIALGEDVLLLDVREAEEVGGEESVKGMQNMPMGKVFLEAAKGTLPKDRPIITVCKSGTRCAIVARELKQKGYDIDYLEGGLAELEK